MKFNKSEMKVNLNNSQNLLRSAAVERIFSFFDHFLTNKRRNTSLSNLVFSKLCLKLNENFNNKIK
jgi:hypothetical protein